MVKEVEDIDSSVCSGSLCRSCWRGPASLHIPNSTACALKSKVNFGVFNVNSVRKGPRGGASPNLKLNYETSKEGKASAQRKCLKEHQCRLVSMNIWCLKPWVQDCSTLFNVVLTPCVPMMKKKKRMRCECELLSQNSLTVYRIMPPTHRLFVRFLEKKGTFLMQLEVSHYLSTPLRALIKTFSAVADWNGCRRRRGVGGGAYVTGRIMRT